MVSLKRNRKKTTPFKKENIDDAVCLKITLFNCFLGYGCTASYVDHNPPPPPPPQVTYHRSPSAELVWSLSHWLHHVCTPIIIILDAVMSRWMLGCCLSQSCLIKIEATFFSITYKVGISLIFFLHSESPRPYINDDDDDDDDNNSNDYDIIITIIIIRTIIILIMIIIIIVIIIIIIIVILLLLWLILFISILEHYSVLILIIICDYYHDAYTCIIHYL